MIVDGYLRISKLNGREGESFISPSVQREQIEGWAQSRGAMIATVFEEMEESGGRADRPMLMSALARVESGLTDGIVVATLDRFGRSLLDGLAAIDRIRAAGGTFASAGDGFDLTTDTGKLVLRIMLSIAEWELDRVRSQWSTARERAVMRGLHSGRRPPIGYLRPADRRLIPDPAVAFAIAEIFRRRGAGATLRELAVFLTELGIPSSGPCWRTSSVGQILRNRVYLGELRSGGYVNASAHDAIVDPIVWLAAQQRASRGFRGSERKPTPLGGLLRCAGCGFALSGQSVANAAGELRRVYSCNAESASEQCESRASIVSRVVEPYADAVYFELRRAADRRDAENSRLVELKAALEVACADTARYRDSSRTLRALGADRFAQGLRKRVAREQKARLAVGAERLRLGLPHDISAEQWEARWPSMSVVERRTAMSEVIDAIFVVRGKGRPEQRLFVCARGEGPGGLPRQGHPAQPISPVDLAKLRRASPADVADVDPWPESRVKQELVAFLSTQSADTWPADEHFVHEGRGPLLRQLELTGGPPRWRRELDSAAAPRSLRHGYWTDANILAALRVALRGRSRMPTHHELASKGYAGLSAAMAGRGKQHWAATLGVECTSRLPVRH